jgi:hypothetical protein
MIKNKRSFLVGLILLISFLCCKYNAWKEKDKQEPFPICYDFYGYYLYLPSTFIYNDPGLQGSWIDSTREIYKPSPTFYQATGVEGSSKRVNIYSIGYSIIFAPGFFAAHALAPSLGYAADGFSAPYQYSLELTAFLFFVLGLIYFRKISLRFFSDTITAVLMLMLLLGSNYFFQVTYASTTPHNFLFALNCMILWNVVRWHEEKRFIHLLGVGLLIGLATACRPVELLWGIVPVLWQVHDGASFRGKLELLKKFGLQIAIALLLLLLVFSIQFIYLGYATGNYLKLNYHGEGFSFFAPYTIDFLFSFKKGWLIYSPVMIFALIGFFHLRKQIKPIFLALTSFFIIYLYVVSSWDCWWYAASFGQRPMVDVIPALLFPAGCFLTWISTTSKKTLRNIVIALIHFCVLLNIFQTWQMVKGILHSERMTWEYYCAVFGRTEKPADADQYLSVDRDQNVFSDYENYDQKYIKTKSLCLDFEHKKDDAYIDSTRTEGLACYKMDSVKQFSPSIEIRSFELTRKSYVRIRAWIWVYLTVPLSESNSCLVICTNSGDRFTKYLTSESKQEIPLRTWTRIHLDYLSPYSSHDTDKTSVYYWNIGKAPVLIDHLQVEVFEPINDYE